VSLEEEIAQLEHRRKVCLDRLEEQTSEFSAHVRKEFSLARLVTQYIGLPLLIGTGLGAFFGRLKSEPSSPGGESPRSSIISIIIQKVMQMIGTILNARHTRESEPAAPEVSDEVVHEPAAANSEPEKDGSILPAVLGLIVEAVPWSQVFSALSARFGSKEHSEEDAAPVDSSGASNEE